MPHIVSYSKSKRRGCIVDMISYPGYKLVCVLFDPAIPTSSFNFIQLFFILAKIFGFIIKTDHEAKFLNYNFKLES